MAESTRDDLGERLPVAKHYRGKQTLLAKTVESDKGETECTIYPAAVPPERRVTTWITASEGAFVSLEDYR